MFTNVLFRIPADFTWKSSSSFTIVPSKGSIEPGQQIALEISHRPVEASVVVSTTVCTVNAKTSDSAVSTITRTVKFSAIGKYPFIHLSDSIIDFRDVDISQGHLDKEFVIKNDSLVDATWWIDR